ncbi:MAG: hydrogenase iron-sulfur subunit [Candidatus Bathyarchaeota archaeon]|nr:MAG: hydrogenase iron-sulfur subunit [Candidatus Bathyarchaeota archaeon]
MTEFEPVIIGLTCNWCAYAGADLAGTSKIQYPPNIRIIRVMCTGRIEPEFIFDAFRMGADGVLIGGCHLGDCHYQEGNYKTALRVSITREVLKSLGIEPERVRLEWISASEGKKFSETVKSFIEEIRRLGPNPLKGAPEA